MGLFLPMVTVSNSIFNLCLMHGIDTGCQNALKLRRQIVDHIPKHSNFNLWLSLVWNSQTRRFRDFQQNHGNADVFSDNNGIIQCTTIDLLRVNVNIVAASNNDKNPVTRFEYPSWSHTTRKQYVASTSY